MRPAGRPTIQQALHHPSQRIIRLTSPCSEVLKPYLARSVLLPKGALIRESDRDFASQIDPPTLMTMAANSNVCQNGQCRNSQYPSREASSNISLQPRTRRAKHRVTSNYDAVYVDCSPHAVRLYERSGKMRRHGDA